MLTCHLQGCVSASEPSWKGTEPEEEVGMGVVLEAPSHPPSAPSHPSQSFGFRALIKALGDRKADGSWLAECRGKDQRGHKAPMGLRQTLEADQRNKHNKCPSFLSSCNLFHYGLEGEETVLMRPSTVQASYCVASVP